MSERYSKLFSLSENLYTQGSPIVIQAGALLKDNESGRLIGQLKLLSISNKIIKLAKVEISCLDSLGRQLDLPVIAEYLDLSVERGGNFGAKTPIQIPDSTARAFTVRIVEVGFADNNVWKAKEDPLEPIATQDSIETLITDPYAFSAYSAKFGTTAKFIARKHNDLWLCTCGAINNAVEEKCHLCDASFADLMAINLDSLKSEGILLEKETLYLKACKLYDEDTKNSLTQAMESFERLDDYKDSVELVEKCKKSLSAIEKKQRKLKKRLAIISSAVTVSIALIVILITVVHPSMQYNKAIALMNEKDYSSAEAIFSDLSYYKDSFSKSKECQYYKALALMDSGKYLDAKQILSNISWYMEADEKIAECTYFNAISMMNDGKAEDAYNDFIELGSYSDSATKAVSCANILGNKAISNEEYKSAINWYQKANNTDGVNEAKYQYALVAKSKNDNDDLVAYNYLKELIDLNYKDSESVYSYLYDWKVVVTAINSSPYSTENDSDIKWNDPVYIHFDLIGGAPDEKTKLHVKYTLPFSTGISGTYTWSYETGESTDFWYGWTKYLYSSKPTNVTGDSVLKVYFYANEYSDEIIGSCETIIGFV